MQARPSIQKPVALEILIQCCSGALTRIRIWQGDLKVEVIVEVDGSQASGGAAFQYFTPAPRVQQVQFHTQQVTVVLAVVVVVAAAEAAVCSSSSSSLVMVVIAAAASSTV